MPTPEDLEKLRILAGTLGPMVLTELSRGMGPLAQNLGARFAQQAGPAIMHMLVTPVKVKRYNENGDEEMETTTIPQLLAELNDNVLDLIDVMAEIGPTRRKKKK